MHIITVSFGLLLFLGANVVLYAYTYTAEHEAFREDDNASEIIWTRALRR